MDARMARAAVLAAALASLGASYRTPNFVVSAPSPQIAEQIGKQAEAYRRDLSVLWLGTALPNWTQPCPITAQVAENLGAAAPPVLCSITAKCSAGPCKSRARSNAFSTRCCRTK